MPKPIMNQEQKISEISKDLDGVFSVLRGEIASEDFYVLLLLLIIYRDGGFDKLEKYSKWDYRNPMEDFVDRVTPLVEESLNILKNEKNFKVEEFESILRSIRPSSLIGIIEIFRCLDQDVLKECFPQIFDGLLFKIAKSQGRDMGEFIQPAEITKLIYSLADLSEKSKVYNPFAGMASFGVSFNKRHDYFGQELNQRTWALGVLRLMAYNRPVNSNYLCEDSILNWPEDGKFDLVVANTPYGLRLKRQYSEVQPGIPATVEQFLIERSLNSLNSKGKLITLFPHGFLFRGGGERRMRKLLVDEDLIDTVISLPGGLLQSSGIPLVVFVLNKDKKLPGKVRFIDATKFVKTKDSREKILDNYRLNSLVNEGYQNLDVVRIIDNGEIRKFEYSLNFPRYFQKHIDGIKLRYILEYLKGERNDLPVKGRLIRLRDLKDDKDDFRLDITDIDESEFKRPLRRINESCVLLAMRWKTLKPTLFEFLETSIFIGSGILSFKVNDKIADKAYLINELRADYVLDQLESLRIGGTIPLIRRDDLLEVVIKLPSLEEQRAKMQGLMELSDKIRVLQRERNALAHGKATSQFNEFASLKHTLGRPRQNILDWTDNILHFLSLKRDGFDALNKEFHEFYEKDILSALKEVKRDINFMTDVLEKGENGFIVEEFDKTLIALTDINSLINELSGNGFNFRIKKFLTKGEKLKERGIDGNRTLLKTLIDNLLTNANKYGFQKKTPENEVVFELKEVDDCLSIEVRNNGKPFPKNFDKDKFITKYSTADNKSGSGLGGYDIHRIASEFNNPDWELILNTDPIYPVIFIFKFPIKMIN